ncbi:MAG TPA: hypothetical protein VGM63_00415 [Mucilaginibacter sp.]
MNGKIFAESDNLYQDQARILFDFYAKAAEKIVREEERIEKEIAVLEEEKAGITKSVAEARLYKWLFCILIVPFIIYHLKENRLKAELAAIEARISEFRQQHNEIFRGYKVDKMGIAYVQVAEQVKYENKSFIVDYAGMLPDTEVKLQLSRQNDLLIQQIAELEKLSEKAPIVETSADIETIDTYDYSRSMQQLNQHDYFGGLERSLRTVAFCMDDLNVTSVSLPLVSDDSEYLDFLKTYGVAELPKGAQVFDVFDTQKYDEPIAKFQELNKLKDSLSRHTVQFEDVLKGLMLTMANSVQAITQLKIDSTHKLVLESNKVLYKILKSPYNHYSPVLEAAEIERIRNENFNYGDSVDEYVPFNMKDSSRVRFNLLTNGWVAEDGSSTNMPFGIHQIHEEIVAPIVQNLLKENRIERLKIYNHIRDQKLDYLNKWHQDTEDFYGRNRAESADLVNLMRASLRDYIAGYNTMASLKKTEDSMQQSDGSLDATVVKVEDNSTELIAAFSDQSSQFQAVQKDFEDYMDRLKEDIDFRAEKFEHIDYYDALLRDENPRDSAVATEEIHGLDSRRRPLIAISPLLAKTTELPPEPSIEEATYDGLSLNLPAIAKNALLELEEAGAPVLEDVIVDEAPFQDEMDETQLQEEFNEEPEQHNDDENLAPDEDNEREYPDEQNDEQEPTAE